MKNPVEKIASNPVTSVAVMVVEEEERMPMNHSRSVFERE